MVLMIQESDLKVALANRRNLIGVRPRADALLTMVTGVFYIPAAFEMQNWLCKGLMLALGCIVTVYGLVQAVRTQYTTDMLYKEIAGMNIIGSSIIAIREPKEGGSNRYLQYWDDQWECWFFPNRRSTPDVRDDMRDIVNYLDVEFKVPVGDCTLALVDTETSVKWSTEHREERHYEYRLYQGDLAALPAAWQNDDSDFEVAGHRCRWMSIADLERNDRASTVNADVIGMVKAKL